MKIEERTTYRCDFCNKLYLRRKPCFTHEERCFYNPANKRLCFSCTHLTQKRVESVIEDDHGNPVTYDLNFCEKVDECLYPPKVEFKGNAIELIDYLNIPMKTECEHYEKNEFEDIFTGLLNGKL